MEDSKVHELILALLRQSFGRLGGDSPICQPTVFLNILSDFHFNWSSLSISYQTATLQGGSTAENGVSDSHTLCTRTTANGSQKYYESAHNRGMLVIQSCSTTLLGKFLLKKINGVKNPLGNYGGRVGDWFKTKTGRQSQKSGERRVIAKTPTSAWYDMYFPSGGSAAHKQQEGHFLSGDGRWLFGINVRFLFPAISSRHIATTRLLKFSSRCLSSNLRQQPFASWWIDTTLTHSYGSGESHAHDVYLVY